MAGRLERIEGMLRERLGGETLARCPALAYDVSRLTARFGRAAEAPTVLWRLIDSTLFNAVFAATERTMQVRLDDGRAELVTAAQLRDLSDRLLALAYEEREETPALRDALFDLSRAGSFAAMRALCARFSLDETERAILSQVLDENGEAS